MDDLDERHNTLTQRLRRLIGSARERLGERNASFAREFAEAGEWELAIETISEASRHGLLLTTSEKQELADVEVSLRRLEPEITRRSVRDLIRGLLRRKVSDMRMPAVEPTAEPLPSFEPPLLREAMPTVARWLRAGLRTDGEESLAAQVDTAQIHALCECGEVSCFSFYLIPPIPVAERRGRWTGTMPNGFESVAIDNGRLAWVQHEFRGPIEAVTDEGLQAIREYQALVGVVPRAVV